MRRRDFFTLAGSAAAAWPLAARAQRPKLPTIGYLTIGPVDGPVLAANLPLLRKGLGEVGLVEGRDVAIEVRVGKQYDDLPALAAGMVRDGMSVLIAGGNNAAVALKAATTRIPIVFALGDDPLKLGLVASLSRPGGNLTGATRISDDLAPKRLELLSELVPAAVPVAHLVNPANPLADAQVREMAQAAQQLGRQVETVRASTAREIETAFARMAELHVGALMNANDGFLTSSAALIAKFALANRMPGLYSRRDYVTAGGLISYAPVEDLNRWAGIYAGRILKGEKPGDLPVVQPTKFELAINLQTAKAIGFAMPPLLLARADEVIE
jgi:putative ABC transport system substrate-binding protein